MHTCIHTYIHIILGDGILRHIEGLDLTKKVEIKHKLVYVKSYS